MSASSSPHHPHHAGATGTSAPAHVAAALRADILDGVLVPGERIREVAVCERFGVGRHTVRAALQVLTVSGLLVHERHRGAHVPQLTRARIDQALVFRRVIEVAGLRLALAAGADLQPVEDAVARLESLSEQTPWRVLIETHQAIHHEIVVASGNARLVDAYRSCEEELQVLFAALRPDFTAHSLAALHRQLMDRLRVGGDVAVQALEDDLEMAGRAAMLNVLERSDQQRGRIVPACATSTTARTTTQPDRSTGRRP